MARAPAAHLKAVYTTATAPLARSDLLGHLQGESIHEKLAIHNLRRALLPKVLNRCEHSTKGHEHKAHGYGEGETLPTAADVYSMADKQRAKYE